MVCYTREPCFITKALFYNRFIKKIYNKIVSAEWAHEAGCNLKPSSSIITAIRLLVKIKGETFYDSLVSSLQHSARTCTWGEQVPRPSVKWFLSFSANCFHTSFRPTSSRLVCGWSFYKGELSLCLLGTAEPQKRIKFRGERSHNDLPVICSASRCVAIK